MAEFKNEMDILDRYRQSFRDDVRTVIREEWGQQQENTKRIDVIDRWMWKVEFKFGPVYLLTIAVILIIIYLIVDKIS